MFFQQMSVLSFILVAFSKENRDNIRFCGYIASVVKKFCVSFQLQTDFSFNLNFTLSCIKICKAQSNLSIITTSF